jgi:hypothetical protein
MPNPSSIPLATQTLYAELVDRAATAAFDEAFSEDGTFVPKIVRDRRYWYFQTSTSEGRGQRYVGPETPDLLERIAHHRQTKESHRDRHALVSTLVRSAYMPKPSAEIGDVVAALSAAGVFRLRGVLVGTTAYQTYSAMLGVRLPAALIRTGDVDVAQFKNVSVAVEDRTPPMLEVLRKVDSSFRPIPHTHDPRRVTTYEASSGIRVDFLTPNEGRASDAPETLRAFGTDAQPLRFLDFLIRDPEPAVLLHGSGIFVQVPAPERFALHKLIVARRRRVGTGKPDKDLRQAEGLLQVLVERRPIELKAGWNEAIARGEKWTRLLGEGLGLIEPGARDSVLKTVRACRSVIPGLALKFDAPAARYDSDRQVVTFVGAAANATVRCAISREALDDHFGTSGPSNNVRLEVFREHRAEFEQLAQEKYKNRPVEEVGAVLIKTEDVPLLRRRKSARARK